MSEVTTPKRIDLGQLSSELGGVGLNARGLADGRTVVTSDEVGQSALDAAVAAHVAVDRLGNEKTLRDSAAQALATNRTFLAITSPTNAQVSAQVKALTRQNNGIIRLLLQQFDGTD